MSKKKTKFFYKNHNSQCVYKFWLEILLSLICKYGNMFFCVCVCVLVISYNHARSVWLLTFSSEVHQGGARARARVSSGSSVLAHMVRKESASNLRDLGSIPGSGRFPGEGHCNPTPVFLSRSRNLACYSPWDCRVGQDWATNTSWLAGSCQDKWVSCICLLVGSSKVKPLPAMQENRVWSLDQEIPWRRKWQPAPVLLSGKFHGLQSMELQRVRHNWATSFFFHFVWQGSLGAWADVLSTN